MIKVTASDLKRNTSDVLNKIVYGGESVVIIRHNKIVAEIIPKRIELPDSKKIELLNKKYSGSRPNFIDVKKSRHQKNWKEVDKLYIK